MIGHNTRLCEDKMTPRQEDESNDNIGTDDKLDAANNNSQQSDSTESSPQKDLRLNIETEVAVDADNNSNTDVDATSDRSETSPTEAKNKDQNSTKDEEDDEMAELWAKLRCGSLRTEEVAERERQKQERLKNRQNRCADYPGLAFGSAMYGSDTMMKFNIIKNELQNIMRSQLKRVDGEVNALSSRVKQLDKNLEESENYIRTATAALADAVALQIEESKSLSDEQESQQSNLSAFDQHVLYLEAQLKDAKMKASHSFQILEDCELAQESLFCQEPTSPSCSNVSTPSTDYAVTPSTDSTEMLENSLIDNLHTNNEANNNVTALSNDNTADNTCLKAIMLGQDCANANLPI